jgi:hypothetical protein
MFVVVEFSQAELIIIIALLLDDDDDEEEEENKSKISIKLVNRLVTRRGVSSPT